MRKPVTLFDAVIQAKDVFYRNADTMIAGFLIRHPDIDPADVELVMTPSEGGVLRFSIEPKELHVPDVADDGVEPFNGGDMNNAYREGWNECRKAMIDQKKKQRAPDALTSLLAESITGDDDGKES